MHILLVAAENGTIAGGKVGGIGDVIRDVPRALAQKGHDVSVITPGYKHLTSNSSAVLQSTLGVTFCGTPEQVDLYRVPAVPGAGGNSSDHRDTGTINHWLLEHPLFAACGEGRIYCHDHENPFATDAHKFALFCLSVCNALVTDVLPRPDFIHLHDWHAALLLFLRQYLPHSQALQTIPTVYTIHNLSIQGIRPLAGYGSTLDSWFGHTGYDNGLLIDPVHRHCVNMMRLGINLADKVHVVSPNYAREILSPSDPEHGFIGGEGLEKDLLRAQAGNRLHGILNGCEYPEGKPPTVTRTGLVDQAQLSLLDWVGDRSVISSTWFFALKRLHEWSRKHRKDSMVLASVGRLTWQKAGLLMQVLPSGKMALEHLLEQMPDGMVIMLGTGEPHYETSLTGVMSSHANFIFLQGYSDALADSLYHFCDAFLMPSSFEPCGISQMLALRAGKPCLVHAVGGLADTVNDCNGFVFRGRDPVEQASAMLDAAARMLALKTGNPRGWRGKVEAARNSRFSWADSMDAYLARLYVKP